MNTLRRFAGTSLVLVTVLTIGVAMVIGGCRGDYGAVAEQNDFLASGKTLSHFSAVQIDPRSEDSAGPQFVVAEDLDGDGMMDLVSAWNQSLPVQIHLQRRSSSGAISFVTTTLAGTTPVVAVAGLAVKASDLQGRTNATTDFDLDGRPDIAVLVKESLLTGPQCLDSEVPDDGLSGLIAIYFGPTDATRADEAFSWQEVIVGASFLQGEGDATGPPEIGGYSSMAVGDMDLDGDMDIVVAWNSSCGDNGSAEVVLFTNGGPGAVRDGTWTAARIPDAFPKGSLLKDVALADIDGDGDLDIVATTPDALTMNVRWYRNPVLDIPDAFHVSNGSWQVGMVGQVATGADTLELRDIDGDDIVDVVVRSTRGRVVQWFQGPAGPTTTPIASIPWRVFTLAEFTDRTPQGFAIGDLNFDGQVEVITGADGGLAWFDSQSANSVFEQWREVLIIDDRPGGATADNIATTDPNVDPETLGGDTFMNSILVVDLDGDGASDLVVTLDRSGLSGLSNDALVWFRNTKRPPR